MDDMPKMPHSMDSRTHGGTATAHPFQPCLATVRPIVADQRTRMTAKGARYLPDERRIHHDGVLLKNWMALVRPPACFPRLISRLAIAAAAAALTGNLALAQTGPPAGPASQQLDGTVNPSDPLHKGPNPEVAEVDGHAISLGEVGDAVRALPGGGGANSFETLYPLVLSRLIQRTVLVLRAHAAGLPDDPVVRRHMQEAADQVLENEYLRRVATQNITEEALLARYDTEIQGQPGPEEVRARVILVPTESAATEVIAKLTGGADFGSLARTVSKDASAPKGGDLGFVRRGALSAELGAVLFELQPGEVTPYPVRTLAGWFVLKAEARQRAPTPSFPEARDALFEEMAREQVGPLAEEALKQSVVRVYNITGQELSGEPPPDSEGAETSATH